uniref:Uncharacterized protein n=1 Tax=Anguilla anguilla TaxID=7936 RepID=A0A0E9TJS3_ANGAN
MFDCKQDDSNTKKILHSMPL